jgi:hypothetical protein
MNTISLDYLSIFAQQTLIHLKKIYVAVSGVAPTGATGVSLQVD